MSEQIGMVDTMRGKALEWIERQIRQTRQSLGRAEYKPGVKPEELENLRTKAELLEFISGAALKADGWISVEDRLPEDLRFALVYIRHKKTPNDQYRDIRILLYSEKYEWMHLEERSEVTHWMPLPRAPERGDDDA